MALDPMNFISSPYGAAYPLPAGGAGNAVAPAAAVTPPHLKPWTEAELDEALFGCAEESWTDQTMRRILTSLAPQLQSRGFACGDPEDPALVTRFDSNHAAAHVTRRLAVQDPLGVADGRRLQANVVIGLVARLGASGLRSSGEVWQRSVRAVATVSLSIEYAASSGESLSGVQLLIAGLELVSCGSDLLVADVSQVTDWWRTACQVEALQSLRGRAPQLLPSLLPGLLGKPEEPRTLDELVENFVERCVSEMAP